jgi:hypothetical protein
MSRPGLLVAHALTPHLLSPYTYSWRLIQRRSILSLSGSTCSSFLCLLHGRKVFDSVCIGNNRQSTWFDASGEAPRISLPTRMLPILYLVANCLFVTTFFVLPLMLRWVPDSLFPAFLLSPDRYFAWFLKSKLYYHPLFWLAVSIESLSVRWGALRQRCRLCLVTISKSC